MINDEEYKNIISDKDVLDQTTLNVTLKELTSRKEFELAAEVKRILENNQIPKPLLHADQYLTSTTHYTVDLSADNIDKIINILFELEESYIGENGETTPTASFYATLVDKWNKLTRG